MVKVKEISYFALTEDYKPNSLLCQANRNFGSAYLGRGEF